MAVVCKAFLILSSLFVTCRSLGNGCRDDEMFAVMGCEERCHGDPMCSIKPICLCPRGLKRHQSGNCMESCPSKPLIKRLLEMQNVIFKPVKIIPHMFARIPTALQVVKKSSGALLNILGSNVGDLFTRMKHFEDMGSGLFRTLFWFLKTVPF